MGLAWGCSVCFLFGLGFDLVGEREGEGSLKLEPPMLLRSRCDIWGCSGHDHVTEILLYGQHAEVDKGFDGMALACHPVRPHIFATASEGPYLCYWNARTRQLVVRRLESRAGGFARSNDPFLARRGLLSVRVAPESLLPPSLP